MTTWQPISTAPKDRRILLFYPKREDGSSYAMEAVKVAGQWSTFRKVWECDQYAVWLQRKSKAVQPELPEDPK